VTNGDAAPGSNRDQVWWMNRWVIGVVGSVIGFLLSQWVALYQFSKNLKTTKEIEMIHLARDVTRDFYSEKDGDPTYRQIRNGIDSCLKIYKSNGGDFTYDQVNRYLGFFDDLGFFYQRGALDEDTIKQLFGAVIIEAYEYPELTSYIAALQKNESKAFVNFQALGKALAKTPEGIALLRTFPKQCQSNDSAAQK